MRDRPLPPSTKRRMRSFSKFQLIAKIEPGRDRFSVTEATAGAASSRFGLTLKRNAETPQPWILAFQRYESHGWRGFQRFWSTRRSRSRPEAFQRYGSHGWRG